MFWPTQRISIFWLFWAKIIFYSNEYNNVMMINFGRMLPSLDQWPKAKKESSYNYIEHLK